MAYDLETYLESVADAAVGILQIFARENSATDSYELDLSNEIIALLTSMAYGQCVSYLNRELAYGYFTDIYPRVACGEVIKIKQFPVKTIDSVKLDGVGLVEGEDYVLENNAWFQLLKSANIYSTAFTTGLTTSGSLSDLRITYKGGWQEALENTEIHSALVAQTVGLFHRKDTLGIGSIKGTSFDGSSAAGSMSLSPLDPDAGGIVMSARIPLDRYRYFGSCLTMSLE